MELDLQDLQTIEKRTGGKHQKRQQLKKKVLFILTVLIIGLILANLYQNYMLSKALTKAEIKERIRLVNDIPNYKITVTKI